MNIYHIIQKVVPEGRFKNKLRILFYRVIYSFTLGSKEVLLNKEENIYGKFYKIPLGNHEGNVDEIAGYVFKRKLKDGDVVVDAGAFHGYFAVYASKKVGTRGKVICFEPEESNFSLLKKNIKLNGLNNVILVKKGLWNKDGVLKFETRGPTSKVGDGEDLASQIEVTTLDELNKKSKKIDFVKMDIEGAEIEAMEGAENLLKNRKTNFAVASYHEVNGKPTWKSLENTFKKYKYKVKTDYPKHLTTYASP